jgi:hypothetical protein
MRCSIINLMFGAEAKRRKVSETRGLSASGASII